MAEIMDITVMLDLRSTHIRLRSTALFAAVLCTICNKHGLRPVNYVLVNNAGIVLKENTAVGKHVANKSTIWLKARKRSIHSL